MKHLAIIADGNRRWAKHNNLSYSSAYKQSLSVIEQSCEWALLNHIQFLTFFCFSTENWKRQKQEIDLIMKLGLWYYSEKQDWYNQKNIKIVFLGRREKLDKKIIKKINELEEKTKNNTSLTLNVCFNYGGRDEIIQAIEAGARTEDEVNAFLHSYAPDPDAIVRTGGNYRLSNFLLWQSAYAELFFLDCFFPDLTNKKLDEIKMEFLSRKRNFGM